MLYPVAGVKEFCTKKTYCGKCGYIMVFARAEPFLGESRIPVMRCMGCERTLHLVTEEKAKQWGIDSPGAYREKHKDLFSRE